MNESMKMKSPMWLMYRVFCYKGHLNMSSIDSLTMFMKLFKQEKVGA